MHFMRLFVMLLVAHMWVGSVAIADTTATLRGPKEFDTPTQTRLGPLTPADTLWRLAEQSRPDRRINMYQMMYALYQKNPDAFLEENFNHLKPGAYLLIPTIREILAVDAIEAQRKSENDDRLWAERVRRVELAKAEAAAAKQLDIVTAKDQLSEELSRVEAQQIEQMSDLRDRIGASMANVEMIVQENTVLKDQLNTVVAELGSVKSQLDKDSEIQTQLQQLLAQQAQLLAQQQEQIRKAEEGFNFAATMQKLASSPVGWAIAGSLPAIGLLFFIVSMIRRRGQKAAAVVTAATAAPVADPNYRSPLPPLDDTLDFDETSLMNLDDSLLNDSLSSGIRLDNDNFAAKKPSQVAAATAFTDDLLDDDFMTPSATKSSGEFDLDNLLDEPLAATKSSEKTEFDPNNILSGDDLSSLFNNLEEEPAFAAKEEFDPNNILSNNELSSLFENLVDDDPDEIFNQALAAQDAKTAATSSQNDDVQTDKVSAEALQSAAAEADQFDELLEEIELDIPSDDVNETALANDDEFDIDSLLAQTQQTTPLATAPVVEPQAASVGADDDFDIDSLLAQNSQPEITLEASAPPLSEEMNQFDSSELDAFAESLAEETLPIAADSVDEITEFLEPEENITELLEPDPTELHNELDDILSEVAELRAQSQQHAALAELALPESALDEAAADFAEADLSVADVSAMLQDSSELDESLLLAPEQPESVAELPALEQEHATTAVLSEDDSFEHELSADDIIELADIPDLQHDLQLDLTQQDEPLITQQQDTASSVERPSQVLDSYPDLDLTDDLLIDDVASEIQLNASDDFLEIDPDISAELSELDQIPFEQLLADLPAATAEHHEDNANPSIPSASSEEEPAIAAELSQTPEFTHRPDDSELVAEFLNIDKLLASTEDDTLDDVLTPLDIDVGLADFTDLINPDEIGDVDKAEAGFASRLDLVKAYNEIGDAESAEQLVKEILASDAPEQVKLDAQALLKSS